MKGCILFASHIPSPDKVWIGKESLDKFVELFSDYHIYIGINSSCREWYDCIEEYSTRLTIFYDTTPEELLIDSDASAFQTALRLLKSKDSEYDIYWFGHTKGAVSGEHRLRGTISKIFWDMRRLVEYRILDQGFSAYSPYIGTTCDKDYIDANLSIFIDGNKNDDLCSYFTFWVHRGDIVNLFLKRADPVFYTSKLTDLTSSDGLRKLDRYFFERDFPMIYQRFADSTSLLFYHCVLHEERGDAFVEQECVLLSGRLDIYPINANY